MWDLFKNISESVFWTLWLESDPQSFSPLCDSWPQLEVHIWLQLTSFYMLVSKYIDYTQCSSPGGSLKLCVWVLRFSWDELTSLIRLPQTCLFLFCDWLWSEICGVSPFWTLIIHNLCLKSLLYLMIHLKKKPTSELNIEINCNKWKTQDQSCLSFKALKYRMKLISVLNQAFK